MNTPQPTPETHPCLPSAGSACYACSDIGLTMGETTVRQMPNGRWLATAPIGSIFGSEVGGECRGEGSTREEAMAALAADRHNLYESLWA